MAMCMCLFGGALSSVSTDGECFKGAHWAQTFTGVWLWCVCLYVCVCVCVCMHVCRCLHAEGCPFLSRARRELLSTDMAYD